VKKMSIGWNEIGRIVGGIDEGKERVVNDVLRSMRNICLSCKKCEDVNKLKWKIGVEMVDGVDVWFMVCEEEELKLYNRISGI